MDDILPDGCFRAARSGRGEDDVIAVNGIIDEFVGFLDVLDSLVGGEFFFFHGFY